jgi:nucleoside-diphosphate-sugar epimerase
MTDKISVFGGSGFIGSRFCELYSDQSIKIDRDDYIPKSDNILYFISTIDNYNIHQDLYLDIDTNLTVSMRMLENIDKNNKNVVINFVSSWFVYGKNEILPFREDTTYCNPTGFYSITKRCAEQMLICFCETFDIKYRIFRLSNVLGVGDKKISKKKNAFQYMVKEIVNNRDVELYYDGNVIRDFIHVDDVCTGIKTCLDNANYNEIINIGSGVPTLIIDLLKTTHALSNSTSELKFINPTKFHNIVQTRNSYLDITKLKKYGFEPKYNVYETINELIEYYKDKQHYSPMLKMEESGKL